LEPHSKFGRVFFGGESLTESSPFVEIESSLYGTTDGGKTFIDLEMPEDVKVIRDLKYNKKDNSLYVLGTGVAYRLTNPMQRLE
jgi:hypothetical protein